jgi:hypothetical protein
MKEDLELVEGATLFRPNIPAARSTVSVIGAPTQSVVRKELSCSILASSNVLHQKLSEQVRFEAGMSLNVAQRATSDSLENWTRKRPCRFFWAA